MFCRIFALVSLVALHLQAVDFAKDIRPILNKKCTGCHGGVKRKGGFSLLYRNEIIVPAKSKETPVVPGHPDKSELIRRIISEDHDERMPPEGDPLKPHEIDLLKAWIKDGAEYTQHWAYIAPKKSALPKIKSKNNVLSPIDYFIQAGLEQKGLSLQKAADKSTIIRRLSFDIRGLPPTPSELDKFLNDKSTNAYEKLVDRFLADPAYGERWAGMWMDMARYADTDGYEKDRGRSMSPYRDWAIQAFNRDLPYNQFTIEQLAGDLLPNATEDQLVATGFLRNTLINTEGGVDKEEFRVAAIIDRNVTTWQTWMGTTMDCVQCHSHPYDPIKHDEYYKFMDFFNSSVDANNKGKTVKIINPNQKALAKELDTKLAHLAKQIEAKKGDVNKLKKDQQKLLNQKNKLEFNEVMVMSELPANKRRQSYVFDRGDFRNKAAKVGMGTPEFLPAFDGYPKSRLGMAQWIVDSKNPLTSRVIVNRFWEQVFGIGLVETLEDFGTQGTLPVNQELLDYLSVEMHSSLKWSMKKLLKKIVMSGTYRQNSFTSAEMKEKDPYNRLLSRGPRFRLSAEMIRDQSLKVSGLLSAKMYGKSVFPYQPDGIWKSQYNGAKWKQSKGGDQYRRALYTYWKRTSPYPAMETFDMPSREFCINRRIRTNTPLQALVTLNDQQSIMAAKHLAKRVLSEGGKDLRSQITYMIKLALSRYPSQTELTDLSNYYKQEKAYFTKNSKEAAELALDKSPQLAAMTMMANVIMNLDAYLTKH